MRRGRLPKQLQLVIKEILRILVVVARRIRNSRAKLMTERPRPARAAECTDLASTSSPRAKRPETIRTRCAARGHGEYTLDGQDAFAEEQRRSRGQDFHGLSMKREAEVLAAWKEAGEAEQCEFISQAQDARQLMAFEPGEEA